jgi:acetyltransferase-like isoleucine patch superfamily enzyme
MKNLLKKLSSFILGFFYKEIKNQDPSYSIKELFTYLYKQKILGYNRNVPWPVHFTSEIKCSEKIRRGTNYPGFAKGCYIDGRNGIIFEENVLVGPHVSIISMNHDVLNYNSYIEDKPIIIRKNSWLAYGCIILPGVEIGEHTIVAAGAVVTKSFTEGNQIIGGNPAQLIKKTDIYKG